MKLYKPGDIVKVRNATNGVGIYMIESVYDKHYKVYVLSFLHSSLYLDESQFQENVRVSPRDFLKAAHKNPILYKQARFSRIDMTTKEHQNIVRKMPFTVDQVID